MGVAALGARRARALPAVAGRLVTVDRAVAAGVAVVVCGLAFVAQGGTALAPVTWSQVALVLGGAMLGAAALAAPGRFVAVGRPGGMTALAGLAALTVLTAVSIVWSIAPDRSWLDANRMLSLLAAFGGAIAMVRLIPHRWNAVLAGLAIASVVICGWALLTKVAPDVLAQSERYARLRAPFSYWNAVGLMAALGIPPLLWLAARRSGHAPVNALAYPGLGLLFVCLMLSYSRGALLAAAVGVVAWLVVVPLRLRSVLALLVAGLPAALIVAWSFAQPGLTDDDMPLALRSDAGHELGVLLALMTVVLLGAGLAVGFVRAYRPPSARARLLAGRALLAALAAGLLLGLGAVALSEGGIGGRVSSAWNELTDPQVAAPDNSPDRFTATSSVRSQYWREAFDIHAESPWIGVGADAYATARKRHRQNQLAIQHAHGYVVQTLADLGWAGLALSLMALAGWLWAAAAALGLRPRDRGLPWDAERVGLCSLAAVVLVFGVHSAIDWTWSVPATAVAALLCAGWVAGRGPLRRRLEQEGSAPAGGPAAHAGLPLARRMRAWRPDPYRTGLAAGVLILAVTAAWTIVQPLRAEQAADAAVARMEAGDLEAATELARTAADRNPVSVDPLFELASVHAAAGRPAAARQVLNDAVALQPASGEAWRRLGRFRLEQLDDPRAALEAFRAAYYLDPQSPQAVSDVIEADRALEAAA